MLSTASYLLPRVVAAALALALLPPAVSPAAASPVAGACLTIAAAQSPTCLWSGTITITQIEDRSTTTPIGDTGGTRVDEFHIKDTTTINVSGGGDASRDYSMLQTVTTNEVPSVQCAAGQPFTTGTHKVVQEERRTGKGAAHVDVSVSADSDGTYTIATGRPVPDITGTSTYNETWNICHAPKPQNSSHNIDQAGGGVIDIGMQGPLDPSRPTTLDGTTTLAPLTFSWHLEGKCGQCDDLLAQVQSLTTMLDDDAAMLKSLVDGLPGMAPAIGGEAPELAAVGVDITAQLISMQADAQRAQRSGGDPDVAFGVAVSDWLAPTGPGGVEIVQLLSGLDGAGATPRPTTGVVAGLMQAAQGLAEKVRNDRDQLAEAQAQLDRCLAAP